MRFVVISCAKYNSGFFNAYKAVAKMDDIDFVLHLGDYIYEAAQVPTGKQTPGADIGRPMDPLGDCMTRSDYDTRYALYRRDADLLHMHARHAIIATIDDHELSDNAWLGGAQEHDDAKDGPWIDRSNAAMSVWSDWMPTLRHPENGDHVWQEIDLGEAGRILLCETRLARTDPAGHDGPDKTALGHAQREWALEKVRAGGPGWTFLALPSMISDLEPAVHDTDALFALHKLKMVEPDSDEEFHDLWDTFGWEQDQLVEAVTRSPAHGRAERRRALLGRARAQRTRGRVHRVDRHLGDLAEPRRQDGLAARRREQELRGGTAEDAARDAVVRPRQPRVRRRGGEHPAGLVPVVVRGRRARAERQSRDGPRGHGADAPRGHGASPGLTR